MAFWDFNLRTWGELQATEEAAIRWWNFLLYLEFDASKWIYLNQWCTVLTLAFSRYFNDGLQTIEHFGNYIEDLNAKLGDIQQEQEDERRALIDVRNSLKNSPGICKIVSNSKRRLRKTNLFPSLKEALYFSLKQKYEKYLHEASMSPTLQMVQMLQRRLQTGEEKSPKSPGNRSTSMIFLDSLTKNEVF